MRFQSLIVVLILVSIYLVATHQKELDNATAQQLEIDAKAFLQDISIKLYQVYTIYNKLANVIADGKDLSEIESTDLRDSLIEMQTVFADAKRFENINNEELKYALHKLKQAVGIFVLDADDVVRFGIHLNNLEKILTTKSITAYDDDDVQLVYYPDIMEKINNFFHIDGVKYYWIEWRDNNGFYAPKYLKEVSTLLKEAAKGLEMPILELWNENFNEEFLNQMDEVMEELKPFYQNIHAYIRYLLFIKYGAGFIKTNGLIPDYLFEYVLEKIWTYDSILQNDYFLGFMDADNIFSSKIYDSKKLLQIAEEFYTSIGFETLTKEFWNSNIILDEHKTCLSHINDNTPNVTVKYCNRSDLMRDYNIMGRIHYARLKQNLPAYYFNDYNLKYAIGETIQLSATTWKRFENFSQNYFNKGDSFDERMEILKNSRKAISTMFTITKYYVLTKVMAGLLDGTVKRNDVNTYYWNLMMKHAGVEPSSDRLETSFDLPNLFYENINDNGYFGGKFTSQLLAYQFYEALCHEIGHVGMLSKCDFYGNIQVGDLLKKMMSLGSSKPWHEVIGVVLPQDPKLDAKALLKYYEPFSMRLKEHISKRRLHVGWPMEMTKQLSLDKLFSIDEAKTFVQECSVKIYELYDQVALALFKRSSTDYDEIEKLREEHDLHYAGSDVYWLLSDTAKAAVELKDIALKARSFFVDEKYAETKRAIKHIAQIADLFIMDDYKDVFLDFISSLDAEGKSNAIISYEKQRRLSWDPDILAIQKNSSDPDELKYYWKMFGSVIGDSAKFRFFQILECLKRAASTLEISITKYWYKHYTMDIMQQMDKVIDDLNVLYKGLHSFIRKKLILKYDDPALSENDAIPDHYYQQVLNQIWTNKSIIEDTHPWHKLPPVDQFISDHKYDAMQMLHEADNFYQSLGLEQLDETFWKENLLARYPAESIMEKCSAVIYDFTPKVYMQYCDQVNFKSFLQAHGYMGRIHYAHEKRQLPAYYFNSYNLEYPLGEAVILSASSLKHLQSLGLTGDFEFTEDVQMNRMLRMGIHTLLNIHMHYVRAKVVHDYLEKKVTEEDFNKYYWNLMIKYAGVQPPLDRTSNDFDFPYEAYVDVDQNHQVKKFVSEVLGYQIYEALCDLNDHQGDLSNCDFSKNKKVGAALKKMMQLGSSKSRDNVLKVILKSDTKLSASGIKVYYDKLMSILWNSDDLADYKKAHEDPNFGDVSVQYWRGTYIYNN